MNLEKKVTKEETSDKKIVLFLDEIQDFNVAHWKNRVLPGMYALNPIKPYISKTIKGIQLNFLELTKFPCEIELYTDNNQERLLFSYKQWEKELYNGKIIYSDEDKNQNAEKILLTQQIGGELQRFFKEEQIVPEESVGIYSSQSIVFAPHNISLDEKPFFERPRKTGKRDYEVGIYYNDEYNLSFAGGTSKIKLVPKKVFERVLKDGFIKNS